MKINNAGSEILRSGYANAVRSAGTEGGSKPAAAAQPTAAPVRSDKVQISDAGRALAARGPESQEPARADLSPERVAELRQKVLEGAYNSVNVVEEIARRMLERGDI